MTAKHDLFAAIPDGPLLGLDLGRKTIGVASCDAERNLAVPVTTINRTKFTADAQALVRLANERRTVAFVIGLPLNMDGSEGPRAQSVRTFALNLKRVSPLPAVFWDERLSTSAAASALTEAGVAARHHKRTIDAHAAAIILQGALDRAGTSRQTRDR